MDEKTRRLVDRVVDVHQKMAESQAPLAIGEAVLALHRQQMPVSVPALIGHLLAQAAGRKEKDLQRLQSEAAARLLGWNPDAQ